MTWQVAEPQAAAVSCSASSRRPVRIRVAHCAASAMAEALAGQAFAAPSLPVVANVLAEANSDPARVGELLVAQVTGRVRWRESVAWMAGQGVTELVELGAGAVLAGLTKRIAPEVTAQSVGTAEGLRGFAQSLS